MPPRRIITDLIEELRLPVGGSFVILGADGKELLRVDDSDDQIRIRKMVVDPYATGGEHPDLGAHDSLGLATDAELAAHGAAADPHPGYLTPAEADGAYAPTHGHPYEASGAVAAHAGGSAHAGLATDAEVATAVADHEAQANPHAAYETSAEAQAKVDTHAAAGDPHPTYATDADLTTHAGTPHGGAPDFGEVGDIAASTFGDSALAGATGEVADAGHRHAREANPVTAHEAAGNPHAVYATDADLTAHEAAGNPHPTYETAAEAAAQIATHAAAADPHTGYQRESEKGAASGYASLDGSTKVPIAQLPTGTTSSTVALGDAAAALDATHAAAADPHTGYQKESEKGAANGYAGLGAGGLVPIAQLASGTPSGAKFVRDDGVLATPGGGDDARFTMRALSSDQADITGITLVEIAGLTVAGVAAGTYQFVYRVLYQTTATTTGVEFVVDHTGTVDRFASNAYFGSTGGAAATGIADQAGVGTAAGIMEVKTARAKNTRPGVTIGVDTANADMLMTVEGVLRVTASGDLKLFMAAELASLVCRARAGSSLVLTKVA